MQRIEPLICLLAVALCWVNPAEAQRESVASENQVALPESFENTVSGGTRDNAVLSTVAEASWSPASTGSSSLQMLIDAAPPGSTLELPDTLFVEGATIAKPLTLTSRSGGTQIRGVLHIRNTNNVVLNRIAIAWNGLPSLEYRLYIDSVDTVTLNSVTVVGRTMITHSCFVTMTDDSLGWWKTITDNINMPSLNISDCQDVVLRRVMVVGSSNGASMFNGFPGSLGLEVTNASNLTIFRSLITGGGGGMGGSSGGMGGPGGNGGAGMFASDAMGIAIDSSTVSGGKGGSGGYSRYGSGPNGYPGASIRLTNASIAEIRNSLLYYDWLVDTTSSLALTNTIVSEVRPPSPPIADGAYALFQNYPNPFNPSTTIRYGVPARGHVTLSVFNALGQLIAILQAGEQQAGYHDVRFDAQGLPSGVYFYKMQAGPFTETKKLLLVR